MVNKQFYMKIITTLLCLTIPAILVTLTTKHAVWGYHLIPMYLITLIGIILFFRFKHYESIFIVLLFGLFISPIYQFMVDHRRYMDLMSLPSYERYYSFGGFYGNTLTIVFMYVMLFILLSFSIFSIIKLKQKKQEEIKKYTIPFYLLTPVILISLATLLDTGFAGIIIIPITYLLTIVAVILFFVIREHKKGFGYYYLAY